MQKIIDNWQDLPFNKYLEIKDLHESENDELTKSIELVAILSSIPSEEIAKIKLKEFSEINQKTTFFATQPDLSNTKHKWKFKSLEETTMDDFITYSKLNNEEENIPSILTFLTKDNITEEQILKMPTPEVLNGFFLLTKQLHKSLNSSLLSLLWKELKKKVTKTLAFWRKN